MYRWRYFAANQRRLGTYAEYLMSSPQDAADLLQDVGLVVLASSDVPRDADLFGVWCRSIARNLALHRWRAARRHDAIFAASDLEDAEPGPAVEPLEDAVAVRELLAALLQDLEPQTCELLVLRYVDGKTSREIARELRQSPAAVRMRLMRAREALRERLASS
jgi:RNA polymerase sigma-70 factor (ECF subfamily)